MAFHSSVYEGNTNEVVYLQLIYCQLLRALFDVVICEETSLYHIYPFKCNYAIPFFLHYAHTKPQQDLQDLGPQEQPILVEVAVVRCSRGSTQGWLLE